MTVFASFGLAQTRVIHGGEACYLHVVEKGNTLYGISKQYAAPIPSLLEVNPEARLGLSIGQKVFIPLSIINRKQAKKSPELEGNVLVHKVQKKETLYSLSKKYKVAINAILESNPGLDERGLKKGEEIRIPTSAAQVDKELVAPAVKDSLLHHEVLLGETLYSLSKSYDVSIDSIREVNGGLSEGLRAGMTLRIPRFVSGYTPVTDSDSSAVEGDEPILLRNPRLQMNLGLLLPFSLSLSDSTRSDIPRGSDDILKMTDIAYEFYRGARLALDDLSNYGLSANVIVKDVTGEDNSVKSALYSNDLSDLDLVIGPLHKESFEKLSKDSRLDDVFMISPLSGSLDIHAQHCQRAAKMRTSDPNLIKSMVSHIKSEYKHANVVMAAGDIRSWHREVKKAWAMSDSTSSGPDSLQVVMWDKSNKHKLIDRMSTTRKNILIFPVEHRPTITELISYLATTEFRDLDITLFGMESWLKYENLDVDVLERVDLHIMTSMFMDWERPEVVDFVKRYKEEFSTIPTASGYAMIAYDITRYYVESMMMYGPDFLQGQSQVKKEGMVSGFDMHKAPSGGWFNEFSYLLRYRDHSFEREERLVGQ